MTSLPFASNRCKKQRVLNPLKWPFYLQTLLAMMIGVAVGAAFGPSVAFLGVIAKGIIQLIKAFATPLLFFAIVDSILHAELKGKGVVWMLAISAIDGACAIVIAFTLINVFHPGTYLIIAGAKGMTGGAAQKIDWAKGFLDQVPDSILSPFVSNNIPGIIVLALFIGSAARALETHAVRLELEPSIFPRLKHWVRYLMYLQVRIIEWIVRLAPIAVFGAVAKAIGESGFSVVSGLAAYLIVCFSGMVLQIAIVYQAWIVLVARIPLAHFWRTAREAAVYAFGVNSSLATLPLTLKTLDKLEVSPASSRLSACVGTNLNNDGILLYEVAAALFIAQAYGIHYGLFEQLGIAAVCVFATIGVAGVPEAGFISLTLVLSTVGLPAESLPLLLTVDWVLGRCRSVTNVISDITVAIGIDAMMGRKRA